MRLLPLARLVLALALLLVTAYRVGPRDWLARQQPWEWGLTAVMLSVLGLLFAIRKVRRPTLWLTVAWFAAGLGATGGCAWLCWYTWTHPAFRNWYAIPVIGALGIFAVLVFWSPFLDMFSKSTRLINRLERAIETSDANADRYLFEARQVVGSGTKNKQTYLDRLESQLQAKKGAGLSPAAR